MDGVQRAREAFQRSLDGLRQELLQAGLPANKVEEIVGKRQIFIATNTRKTVCHKISMRNSIKFNAYFDALLE